MTSVIWFRNDLRTHDNPVLYNAVQESEQVVPVYVFDQHWFETTMYDMDRMGSYRAKFLWEAVEDLRDSLCSLGGDLLVRNGNSVSELKQAIDEYDADSIHFQTMPSTEELEIENNVRKDLDTEVNRYWTHTLYHINDLPTDYRNIDDTFTPWRKETQYNTEVRDTLPELDHIDTPELPNGQLPEPSQFDLTFEDPSDTGFVEYEGGESAALDRVQEYIWDADKLREYKETRNELLGKNYSSKFSPWLAHGCLSPRYVYEEVHEYEQKRVSNDSTYWLVFELMWRDFFQFQFVKHGREFFKPTGIRNVEKEWRTNRDDFEMWANGETGIPFVDANMRELNKTGYMSNRGRQNVASFLIDVLDIDWRMGAAYFESKLVDYDVASNWGNWAYIAGVGNDSRDDRYFNVIKQSKKYDNNGQYIRHWIPELEGLPAEATHEPWNMNQGQQAMYDVQLGIDYPRPMVDIQNNRYQELVNNKHY